MLNETLKMPLSRNIKYFNISSTDEKWGAVVTTVGYQQIPPNSPYPLSQHPESHIFNPTNGRVLKEYQLIYITNGGGYFESQSCRKRIIESGTVILLFPNEWHTYEPNKETGWIEYWIGFNGEHIDERVLGGFFSKANPLYKLGFNMSLVTLYEDALKYAEEEKTGYQQIISSIVLYMLGIVFFVNKNLAFDDSFAINKINEARTIMKREIESDLSVETLAHDLNVSYSWFRKMFKKYVDVSPAHYQANLKWLRAKELLDTTDLNIAEIAYRLNFESPGRFSTFFRKKEGIPPLHYRKEGRQVLTKSQQQECLK